jgi:hypothetical protein
MEYAAPRGTTEMHTHIWSENLKAKEKLGDLHLNGMIILRLILTTL